MTVSQTTIGRVTVQSKPAHFFVQMIPGSSYFSAGVIPFGSAVVNEGGYFDLPSATFTAPVNGLYHFQFSAISDYTVIYLNAYLQVNGKTVAGALTEQTAKSTQDSVSLNASLQLSAGDKVNIYNDGMGGLKDSQDYTTNFSGWLVEENLVAAR